MVEVEGSIVSPRGAHLASQLAAEVEDLGRPVRDAVGDWRAVPLPWQTEGRIGGPDGAAALLGLKRTTFITRMKKLGIDPSRLSQVEEAAIETSDSVNASLI